ncbi:MAG TPA: pilus assembly protein TadG-related protein [Beijerinckiaceae bacterium]|nr:pilus assembly protein TadG-related protein [Beijerinckiaceae bacterium]
MFRKFARNNIGAVTIIGALALPILLGAVALVAEFGQGLSTKIENQRVADLAAVAGALAYNSTGAQSAMVSAAQGVAALNGVPAGDVAVSLVTSPSGDGNQAVSATVSTSDPLVLAKFVGYSKSVLPVSSLSYAELAVQEPACIVALSASGTGVTLSGGTAVSAPGCSVASDASVTAPCGTSITTKIVAYDSGAAPTECDNNIAAPNGGSAKFSKTATPDPLAADVAASGVATHMASVASQLAPSAPSVPSGGDINFTWSTKPPSAVSEAQADGCTATFNSPVWTLTCPTGTHDFGNITIAGGLTLNFNVGGDPSSVYNFSGAIINSGTAMNFGPGAYNVAQGIVTEGGTNTTFAAGTFTVGPSASTTCNGANYSICNNGTSLVFGGPSTFVLADGVFNGGGLKLILGSGTTNSFELGPSSSGDAVNVGGGSTTTFADATGGSSVFSVVGNLNLSSGGGGACTTLSAAAQHDIDGNVSSAGGLILGAGIYTVNGYFALGAGGGGAVNCNGQEVGLSANDVTLAISGVDTPSGCAGQALCIGAGFSDVSISAPTTGPTANLAVIGPTSSSNTAGADLMQGASGVSVSGAFYFPNGPINISGGASLGGAGQCLELIGSQVSLSGGSALASTCVDNSSSTSTVTLVQ